LPDCGSSFTKKIKKKRCVCGKNKVACGKKKYCYDDKCNKKAKSVGNKLHLFICSYNFFVKCFKISGIKRKVGEEKKFHTEHGSLFSKRLPLAN
jgi:hypothetical protein